VPAAVLLATAPTAATVPVPVAGEPPSEGATGWTGAATAAAAGAESDARADTLATSSAKPDRRADWFGSDLTLEPLEASFEAGRAEDLSPTAASDLALVDLRREADS
jgi:hypothetical protein